ncbi:MAG: SLBB domain-containing protein, partial [Planctomycetaceae bacterium]|nr:SLBB domain-containing protein [Planctomycetaceae bacterium]
MPDITIDDIREAGVVGAGGAGFPTHVKLAGKADAVIINAAECEPLLHKDKEMLREYVDEVLNGLATGMRLVGAERGIVGVKEKYHDVIDLLRSKLPKRMNVAPLRDAYPAGDEFILVYDVLGRVVPPGGIPLAVGAVVMNVETATNVSRSARGPVTEKYLTVAGAVAEPVTLRVPLGITLAECVAAAGGPTIPDANYIVGGVMMGYLEPNHDALVDKTTGGVIVLPDNHVLVRRRRRDWQQVARIGRSACDQCSFCTELCPRYLLGHPIEPHRAMRSLGFNLVGEANVIGTQFCCECNLCSMYSCPEGLDPKSVCSQNKRRLASEKKRWEKPPFNAKRPDLHMINRKAPTSRLMTKLDLRGFRNVG